jgi:hypothetical protein
VTSCVGLDVDVKIFRCSVALCGGGRVRGSIGPSWTRSIRMVGMKGAYGRATELKDIWERRRQTDSID